MNNVKQTTSRVALIALLSAAPVLGFAQSTDTNTNSTTSETMQTEPTDGAATEPMTGDDNMSAETEAPAADTEMDQAQSDSMTSDDNAQAADNTEPMTDDTAQSADPVAPTVDGSDESTDMAADPAMNEEADVAETDMEQPAKPVEGQITMQSENTILAQSLIGSSVYSTEGESIGDIDDLIVNLDGTVEGVVIGVGGFLGLGEKDVAIEMASLSTQTDENGTVRLMSNATKADLEAAEAFMTAEDQAAASMGTTGTVSE